MNIALTCMTMMEKRHVKMVRKLKSLNHKINAFSILCKNSNYPQKHFIFIWSSIFHNRVAAESQKL